ncbi:MAG: hypothetical protein WEE66_14705 [Actinomycetota bacterium]
MRTTARTISTLFVAMAVIAVLVVALAGSLFGSSEANAPGWGCPRERIGHTIADSAGRGGSPTELEAARAWIPSLVEDGTIPADRLEAAFGTSSGPSSYDVESGELSIDGDVVAHFGVNRLSDGTWTVGSVEHCMRPPIAD